MFMPLRFHWHTTFFPVFLILYIDDVMFIVQALLKIILLSAMYIPQMVKLHLINEHNHNGYIFPQMNKLCYDILCLQNLKLVF
jgi:hypothetical protein